VKDGTYAAIAGAKPEPAVSVSMMAWTSFLADADLMVDARKVYVGKPFRGASKADHGALRE
jgi:hypothetical protein